MGKDVEKKEKKEKKKTSKSDGGVAKEKRAPSAYNIYMKAKLAEAKEAHPDLEHKERFKKVAESWKDAPENPKNKK